MPALIIDDEADQASLNNQVRKGNESPTYQRIVQLRNLLHHHTFLQYTATPQALLLINIIDVLSPGFAALLTPGAAYVGGEKFFEHDFRLVRRIPLHDIPSKHQPLSEPPDSLLEAMRVFFLGVAIGVKDGSHGNRSMMVHPSKETAQHGDFYHWVRQIQKRWHTTLSLSVDDQDREDLLATFQSAYRDLADTTPKIPPFEDVVQRLPFSLKSTVVVEVNTTKGPTPQPDWEQEYSHIVIGGEVLNRGYTIEGLTVSYMPRHKGTGNADTIQQRARWFGYKAEYLGLCRVYLGDDTLQAYRNYISHEEDVRRQLRNHLKTGRPLSQWRRAFLLSPDLRPTRSDVLDVEYSRGDYADSWFHPFQPHYSDSAVVANRAIVESFVSHLTMQPDEEHIWKTEMQHHSMAHGVSLRNVYDELLIPLRWAVLGDSQKYFGLLLQIDRVLQMDASATCSVYLISGGKERGRSVDDNGNIKQLFQGYQQDKTGKNYPGDEAIRANFGVSVQIWKLRVETPGSDYSEVPLVTVWVPKTASSAWIAQPQGGSKENVS